MESDSRPGPDRFHSQVCEIPESGGVVDSQFDRLGEDLVTVSSGIVTIWRLDRKNTAWNVYAQWDAGHDHPIKKVATLETLLGRIVSIADTAGVVSIWQVLHSALLGMLQTKRDQMDSPNEAQKIGILRIGGDVNALALSQSRKSVKLAIGAGKRVIIAAPSPVKENQWQVESTVQVQSDCSTVAWLENGPNLPAILAIGTDTTFEVWNKDLSLMYWRKAQQLSMPGQVTTIASTPSNIEDRQEIAVGSGDQIILLQLELISRSLGVPDAKIRVEEIAKIQQEALVNELKWHPLNSWLAASLHTKTICIWRKDFAGKWQLVHTLDEDS